MTALRHGIPWAGIAAGPLAWAVTFQTNYALAPWQCASGQSVVPWISAAGVLFALLGGASSFMAWRRPALAASPSEHLHTRRFVGGLGFGVALLFAAAMLLQLGAGLVFGGCEQ